MCYHIIGYSLLLLQGLAGVLLLLLEEGPGSVDHLVKGLAGVLGLAVAQPQRPLDAHLRMGTGTSSAWKLSNLPEN